MNNRGLGFSLVRAVVLVAGMLFGFGALAADSGNNAAGSKVFHSSDCMGCHGPKGEGIPTLAPALKGNKFVTSGSESEIADTIKYGRSGSKKRYKDLSQPMPGHPDLNDQQLKDLVEYLKNGLQKG